MSDRLIFCAASSDDYVLFSLNTSFQPVIYPSDSPGLEARLDTAAGELAHARESLADAQLLAKELQAKNARLEADLHAQAQTQNEMLESVRAQYNELMDTAARFREEAVRWHDIACRRETKPVPGESLITDNW